MSARFRENEIYIYSSVTTGNYSGIQSIKAACPDIPDPEAALAAAPASVADAVTGRVKCGAAVKADTEPDISTIGDSAEALINAGKNADPTTFLYELHHAIMLMGDNMKEFRDVYMKVKDTKQFRSFLKKNMDILKYVLGKKDEDGKFVRDSKGNYILDETILDSLLKSDTKWTTADFEFEAP